MDFQKNYISLDEAGFNVNIIHNRGWSKKGHLPKPSFRPHKVYPLVLDVISVDGVIDISLKKPTTSFATKKGEVGGREIKINGRHDGLFGSKLVPWPPIHKPAGIRELIKSRRYKCVYLPPYAPFLNYIEEFWSKVTAGTERKPLDSSALLKPKLMESVTNVTLNDCHGWIKHAVSFSLSVLPKK
ncbi:hypothetical protein INT47_006881 [Mucor saturninus]|uniref:Tc1-like transposase DDE domain-containing protein n=1 Tax=Mucor saturninus TaxID=64648 RepID=A0A8H7RD30_9FUNG|nr:hypothetical protein INT47_006881 [Mucor saturninus]